MKKEEILSRKAHHNREDLIGEHPIGDLGQIILIVIFLVVWIADSFFLRYSLFLTNSVSLFLRLPVGLVILFCARLFVHKGLNTVFGKVREKPVVIREGVFNMVRHPVYLGAILGYFGLIVMTFSLAAIFIFIIIIIFYHFIARHEEKLLLDKFSADYEKYKKQVPMWVPKLLIKDRSSK